jgi:Fur family transcriptional regulator, ferric uptake regulator
MRAPPRVRRRSKLPKVQVSGVLARSRRKPASPHPELIARALQCFKTVLHDRSLKMSKVRESIARAALGYDGHFSVDDLLRLLQQRGVRDAHLATIYRAVPLMIEAGLIQPALVPSAEGQRYEASFEREHHDHLVCTSCSKVIEYHSPALEALQRTIATRHGFVLEDHVLELRGRCKACRRSPPPSH